MITPGLERIGLLLKDVQFPWKAIHVAGTNGKGSICAYASALLTRRIIRNGRFTSPHVIDRWDCIAINDKPVGETKFRKVENHFLQLNEREGINASEFELLTATAFQLFNDAKVEVGVVEVGMGGRLDATNILNNQVVSVISKIAREHQNFLGNTIEEIAHHKAGILRPNVPYIVNEINEWNVHDVIRQYAEEIGAGPLVLKDTPELRRHLYASSVWHKFAGGLQPFRRDNAVLAYLAVVETLKSMHLNPVKLRELLPGIKNKSFPGRFQHLRVRPVFGADNPPLLVDGAHNTDAALALDEYIAFNLRHSLRKSSTTPSLTIKLGDGRRITWVIAMSDGKDAFNYLGALLKAGDNILTTTFGPVDGMPWVKPMNPNDLLQIARKACPGITGFAMPVDGTFRALCAAKYLSGYGDPIVVTGSLYLVGDLLREKNRWDNDESVIDINAIHESERARVNSYLSQRLEELDRNVVPLELTPEQDEKLQLKNEIEKLDQELSHLEKIENVQKQDRFRELQNDIAAMQVDEISETDGSGLKTKSFSEIEEIRKQIQTLQDPSQTQTPSAPCPQENPRHFVENVGPRPTFEAALVKQRPRVRIRTHVAADKEDNPFIGRASDGPDYFRRTISQDPNADELHVDRRKMRKSPRQPGKESRVTSRNRSYLALKRNHLRQDYEGTPGPRFHKHISNATESKKY